jgi:hypothetical protein
MSGAKGKVYAWEGNSSCTVEYVHVNSNLPEHGSCTAALLLELFQRRIFVRICSPVPHDNSEVRKLICGNGFQLLLLTDDTLWSCGTHGAEQVILRLLHNQQ